MRSLRKLYLTYACLETNRVILSKLLLPMIFKKFNGGGEKQIKEEREEEWVKSLFTEINFIPNEPEQCFPNLLDHKAHLGSL